MYHIIGIIAMIFGFISLVIKNYDSAIVLFGFALILWCVIAIYEYIENRKHEK